MCKKKTKKELKRKVFELTCRKYYIKILLDLYNISFVL